MKRMPGLVRRFGRADRLALASIFSFFVAFFSRSIFGNAYLMAGDSLFYTYPLRTIAWRMIRSGELPLWTPGILSGYPLLSMAQLGLAYPLTWGYLILPGHVAEMLYILAPFLIAPLFTYAYLRNLNRSPSASLFGALAFGYGGMMSSPLANNGLVTNAFMWLPLLLLIIDKSRKSRLIPCLLCATVVYSLSVLTGLAQIFITVGLVAALYSLWLAIFSRPTDSLSRWRPVIVTAGAGLLSLGVAAFQIMETARVVRRSVRSALSYELFTEGSFKPREAWLSFTTPIFHVIDMHASVVPLAAALACVAVIAYLLRRNNEPDPRVFFWFVVAIVSIMLMMGEFTPFYRIVYYIPILNLFRVPSRHIAEWTFAAAVLAAYGWDALAPRVDRLRQTKVHTNLATVYPAIVLIAISLVVAYIWWFKAQTLQALDPGWPDSATTYRLFKYGLAILLALAIWRAGLAVNQRWRGGLITAAILITCFVEPSLLVQRWWGINGRPSNAQQPAATTRYLQQLPPSGNRIYTRVDLMSEQKGPVFRLDATNLSAMWGLQDVAGYEPLVLDRYSRALGGVWLDGVHTIDRRTSDASLFSARSHVLDLLNTTHVVSFENLNIFDRPLDYKDGVGVFPVDLGMVVAPGESVKLTGSNGPSNQLILVTSLSNSVNLNQGAAVARIRVTLADGTIKELDLRAGVETSEWAHERPDVKAVIKHELAPIFDSRPGDKADSFPANRFWARLDLGSLQPVKSVEVVNISERAELALWRATLYNSSTQTSSIIIRDIRSEFWQTVYSKDRVEILHNTRALPRAWLVAEARAVDGETALHEIRGEGNSEFDPRRTALLEVLPAELPSLPGGQLGSDSTIKITNYEPARIRYETNSSTATILVASEIFYPGWTAEVDGKRVRILLTNFLLRGVSLPPGQHTIEFRYTATAARNGAFISVFSLGIIGALFFIGRRKANTRN